MITETKQERSHEGYEVPLGRKGGTLFRFDRDSFTLRKAGVVLFACLMGGAFEIHTALLLVAGERTGTAYLAVVVGCTVLVLLWSLVSTEVSQRALIPCLLLLAFGFLPYTDLLHALFLRSDTYGIFSYLYKFSPYLTILFWLSIVRKRGLRTLVTCVKIYTAIIAAQQILAFTHPSFALFRAQVSSYDSTFVYEHIGPFPRVFGPGLNMLNLGVLIYVGDWIRKRLSIAGVAGLALVSLGILTTMTRGTTLILLLFVVILIWLGARYRTGRDRRSIVIAALVAGLGTCAIVASLAIGAFTRLVPASVERLSTDASSLEWRQAQVDRAFDSVTSMREVIFGSGAETFVQNDTLNEELTTNALHFSYASILWTYGIVGLSILVLFLTYVLILGWKESRGPSDTLEWFLGLVMFASIGAYGTMFTESSSNLGITLCVAAICGSVHTILGKD